MYDMEILIHGFPGRATRHGGLGWSTIPLLRGHGETALIDTGGYGYRGPLLAALRAAGVEPAEVTAVVLTHCHWDHACNFPLFPNARIMVPRPELEWAVKQPPGTWELPEFHVEKLAALPSVTRIDDGEEPLPSITAIATPGHTPGHFAYRVAGSVGPILFSGDAVKNETELMSGQADMTLDAKASRKSIEKIREMLLADSNAVLVCGHDRVISLEEGKAVARSELKAGITVWLPGQREQTIIDLAG